MSLSLEQTTNRLKHISETDDIKSLTGLDSAAFCQLSSKFEFATTISKKIIEVCNQWWKESMPTIGSSARGGLVSVPNDLFEHTVISILKSLSKLVEEDYIILPGGWANNYSGHAVLFVIQREKGATLFMCYYLKILSGVGCFWVIR